MEQCCFLNEHRVHITSIVFPLGDTNIWGMLGESVGRKGLSWITTTNLNPYGNSIDQWRIEHIFISLNFLALYAYFGGIRTAI